MKSLALLNEKGGIGRTTLAAHIAAGLALKGRQVLLIDADPQGSATVYLGLDRQPDIYNLMVRNAPWQECYELVDTFRYVPDGFKTDGSLRVVRSNVETRNIANTIVNASVLLERLSELEGFIDYAIIDTSPTPSLLHQAIVVASQFVLFPTKLESMSALTGLPDTLLHTDETRNVAMRYNIDVGKFMGIVPNMYRKNTKSHNAVLTYLMKTYGNERIFSPIAERIIYGETALRNQLIYVHGASTNADREMRRLVERVEKAMINEQQA